MLRWLIFASLVTITVLPLIQSAVRVLLDFRNAATVSKQNVIRMCNYHPKMVETILSMCYIRTHSPLIISTNAGIRCFAVVAILNTYVVHDLNSLDAYTLCTVHEHNSVVARLERINCICAIAYVLCSTLRDTCIHCSPATHEYLAKFLK